MTKRNTTNRRQLTPEELEITSKLRSIWDTKKKELDLTQEKAAFALGWTQGAVGQYLNGKIPLNTDALLKLAELLEVEPKEIDPSIPFTIASDKESKIKEDSALYMALTPETNQIQLLRSVIETIETILQEEQITLSPQDKAQAIIACLQTCIKRGINNATDSSIAATAIHAVI